MAEPSFTEGYFYMQKEKLSAFMDGEVLDKEFWDRLPVMNL